MLKLLGVLFFISFVFYIELSACEGDCLSCHPKLLDKNGKMDTNHQILSKCKNCHTKKSLSKIDMGTDSCGQDCWQCHDIKKVQKTGIEEHKHLDKCIKCHISIDKNREIFKIGKNNFHKKEFLVNLIEKYN